MLKMKRNILFYYVALQAVFICMMVISFSICSLPWLFRVTMNS